MEVFLQLLDVAEDDSLQTYRLGGENVLLAVVEEEDFFGGSLDGVEDVMVDRGVRLGEAEFAGPGVVSEFPGPGLLFEGISELKRKVGQDPGLQASFSDGDGPVHHRLVVIAP